MKKLIIFIILLTGIVCNAQHTKATLDTNNHKPTYSEYPSSRWVVIDSVDYRKMKDSIKILQNQLQYKSDAVMSNIYSIKRLLHENDSLKSLPLTVTGGTLRAVGDNVFQLPKFDTIKVVMLVCDTSRWLDAYKHRVKLRPQPEWLLGYKVPMKDSEGWVYGFIYLDESTPCPLVEENERLRKALEGIINECEDDGEENSFASLLTIVSIAKQSLLK